ncbi:MAG: hypothetical protein IT445_00075 [Phycisphaeraceae bacterium]|nr:hypothetical protein [Phycisphaeraceae bacterium]
MIDEGDNDLLLDQSTGRAELFESSGQIVIKLKSFSFHQIHDLPRITSRQLGEIQFFSWNAVDGDDIQVTMKPVMAKIEISPLTQPNRAYVQITDPRTKKSRSFTLHGVTIAQAVKLLRRGVELATQEASKQLPDRDAA